MANTFLSPCCSFSNGRVGSITYYYYFILYILHFATPRSQRVDPFKRSIDRDLKPERHELGILQKSMATQRSTGSSSGYLAYPSTIQILESFFEHSNVLERKMGSEARLFRIRCPSTPPAFPSSLSMIAIDRFSYFSHAILQIRMFDMRDYRHGMG